VDLLLDVIHGVFLLRLRGLVELDGVEQLLAEPLLAREHGEDARLAEELVERAEEPLGPFEQVLGEPDEVAGLLVEESIGPLLAQPAQHAEVLLTTLASLIEHNGSPTHAAEALFCHRNTVIYRMKQIEQLTGRSLQVPRDRLLLVLGLMATGRSSRAAQPVHA